jgi:hypothetical protein
VRPRAVWLSMARLTAPVAAPAASLAAVRRYSGRKAKRHV